MNIFSFKKTNHPKSFFAISGCVFICLAFLFISCENFLDGYDVKRQLDERIAYMNATECSLAISQDTTMGSFLSTGEKICKVGYTTQIQFKVNKDYYIFKTLEAVSYLDPSESRADCVEFTINEEESDEEKGVYIIDIKLLKSAKDILIQPVCLAVPVVLSHTPASSVEVYYANTPIVIKFNMPMEPEGTAIKDSLFKYPNIKLLCDGEPIHDLFETPFFNSTKDVLTIIPKGKQLEKSIKSAYITVEVYFENNISVTTGDMQLPLHQDKNSNFTVRYKAIIEDNPPIKDKFSVTRHEVSLETIKTLSDNKWFTSEAFTDTDNDSIIQNRTTGLIYVYGRYYDPESGVGSVEIKEHRIKNSKAEEVPELETKPAVYTMENAQFVKEAEGFTSFCIPYTLKSNDGFIILSVTVKDYCENPSATQTIQIIKKSSIDIENGIPVVNNLYYDSNSDYPLESEEDILTYNESLKTLSIFTGFYNGSYGSGQLSFPYYKNADVPGKDISIICEYTDKDDNLVKEPFVYFNNRNPNDPWEYSDYHLEGWNYTLKNIDSVEGMTFKVTIEDDMGLTYEQTFEFPSRLTNAIISHTTINSTYGYYVSFVCEKGTVISDVRIIDKHQYAGSYEYYVYHNSTDFHNNGCLKIYDSMYHINRVSLCNNGLWGPVSTKEFSSGDYVAESLAQVSLNSDPYVEKTSDPEYLNVIFTVDQSVWNTYDAIYFKESDSHEAYFFEKNSTTCAIPRPTSWLITQNSSNNYTYLYGVKGSRKTAAKKVTFPDIDVMEYDEIPPVFNSKELYRKMGDHDNYQLNARDCETGIAQACIVLDSEDEITFYENDNPSAEEYSFTIDIPITTIMSYQKYIGDTPYIRVKLTDAVGNTRTELVKTKVDVEGLSGEINSGKYDFILPNGAQKDSVVICSDAPVYVHTVYFTSMILSPTPNENPLEWSLSDWENNKLLPDVYGPYVKEIGEEFMIFSEEDHTPQRYAIPVNQLPDRDYTYYCVIVHFSDGTRAMSEVFHLAP